MAGRLTQNVAVLASQGTIRHNVAGLAPGPLGPRERAAARRETERALADGAVGLSSGLDYLPSRFGGAEEIADIARPLAAAGRPYVSHLRAYGAEAGSGLAELVAVGRAAGIRVHASHLWGAPAGIEAAFRSAGAEGVSITYDMYPYRVSSTILASLLLPAGLQARGPEHTLAALADPGSGYQRAARHLSANAAGLYGLRNRGRLAPGMAADICVIGPGGLTARATYGAPRETAAGADLVIVNGHVAWRDGQAVTTGFPGQLVS